MATRVVSILFDVRSKSVVKTAITVLYLKTGFQITLSFHAYTEYISAQNIAVKTTFPA